MATRKRTKADIKSKNLNKKPARRLVEVSPHRTVGGVFVAELTPYAAEHESYIERFTIATLSVCDDVHSIESQSDRDRYIDSKNDEHAYTRDFKVSTFVPCLIIECKALKSLLHSKSIEKYQDIARHYLDQRQPFAFLVDAQLTEEPRFSSVKLLFRYVTSSIPGNVLERAQNALAGGPLSIPRLVMKSNLELVDIYTLVAKRHLSIDWSKPLNGDATVSLTNQPFKGLKLEDILRSTRFYPLLEDLAMGRRPTDQQLMANAKAWRQLNRELGPFNFVGGFTTAAPLRDLSEEESTVRKPWSRGNFSTCRPVIQDNAR